MPKVETFQRTDLALEQALMTQNIKADQGAFHSIELGGNKRSILVDPVNGSPYVYELGGHFTVFTSAPRSGTDHLRARTQASLYFQGINAPAPASETQECSAGMGMG